CRLHDCIATPDEFRSDVAGTSGAERPIIFFGFYESGDTILLGLLSTPMRSKEVTTYRTFFSNEASVSVNFSCLVNAKILAAFSKSIISSPENRYTIYFSSLLSYALFSQCSTTFLRRSVFIFSIGAGGSAPSPSQGLAGGMAI